MKEKFECRKHGVIEGPGIRKYVVLPPKGGPVKLTEKQKEARRKVANRMNRKNRKRKRL
jgi:hypothetical protein